MLNKFVLQGDATYINGSLYESPFNYAAISK